MPKIESARIHALIAMLYPSDMTPTAKHLFEQVLEEEEKRNG